MDPVTLRLAKNFAVGPVDLTGQADGDYIRNDAGVYKPRTPTEVLRNIINADSWHIFDTAGLTAHITTGTGSVLSPGERQIRIDTGTDAGSTAIASTWGGHGWLRGHDSYFDWRKLVILNIRISSRYDSAGCVRHWTIGERYNDSLDASTRSCVGVRVDDTAVKGIAYDGETLRVEDLSATLTFGTTTEVWIISNNGSVDWYINGVSKGSIANGPASNGTGGSLRVYATNGADTTNTRTYLYDAKLYCEQ